VLRDKAELAGITAPGRRTRHLLHLPHCRRPIRKPAGRTMTCTVCGTTGHRDLFAAAAIATRTPGGGITTTAAAALPCVVTHRRAGRHLPGAGLSRRDPRRPHPGVPAGGSVGRLRPAPPTVGSRSPAPHGEEPPTPAPPGQRSWSQHYRSTCGICTPVPHSHWKPYRCTPEPP
jgi:putative transposase